MNDQWILEELELPTKREVCPRCGGDGHHINPAIGAITQSDREEMGEEFYDLIDHIREGWYDVICDECNGNNVVSVVDRERCTPAQLAEYDEWVRDMRESYAIQEAERRAGA